jgi:hypothetical protein
MDGLRRLAERTLDLRTLDLAGFRRWLHAQLVRWRADPVFAQRARIRDLRRTHPELRALERAYREAKETFTGTPAAARLAALNRQRHRVEQAVAGLTHALADAGPIDRRRLEEKWRAFAARQAVLDEERARLHEASPELQAIEEPADRLRRLRAATGLDREEARLAELQVENGRRAGRAGSAFEDEVAELTRHQVVPRLAADRPELLRSVRLGAAGVELDFAVVSVPPGQAAVEVLAVVEAKRNINDLAHGFLRRQIDLAWLTSDRDSYDPAAYRTGHYPSGHFDRPAVHWQDGRAFVFGPGSFGRFRRDAPIAYFLDGLYLVTRAGPVWGVKAAALGRIARRVATDEEWHPTEDDYLQRLYDWCRSLAGQIESPDVLRLYTESAERARQLRVIA